MGPGECSSLMDPEMLCVLDPECTLILEMACLECGQVGSQVSGAGRMGEALFVIGAGPLALRSSLDAPREVGGGGAWGGSEQVGGENISAHWKVDHS